MTIEDNICVGGVIPVPDLRGAERCYKSFSELTITQTPEPGFLVGEGHYTINVLTEDGNGNATVCSHDYTVHANNPAPTLVCPESFDAWLLPGGYEVPDFTALVEINGGCTLKDNLVVVQSPPEGTVITESGDHVITISVEDEFGNTVVCGSTTVTISVPGGEGGGGGGGSVVVTPPMITFPPIVPIQDVLAYWPLHTMDLFTSRPDLQAQGFKADIAGVFPYSINNFRHLTNNGGVTEADLDYLMPGIYGEGYVRLGGVNGSYLSRADDVGLRLLGTDFTIRFGLKLTNLNPFTGWHPILKAASFSSPGYYFRIARDGVLNNYAMDVHIHDGVTLVTTGAWWITLGQWTVVHVVWDNTAKALRLYYDGSLKQQVLAPGFNLTGDSTELRIGDPGANGSACIDDLVLITGAWSDAQVQLDYEYINIIH